MSCQYCEKPILVIASCCNISLSLSHVTSAIMTTMKSAAHSFAAVLNNGIAFTNIRRKDRCFCIPNDFLQSQYDAPILPCQNKPYVRSKFHSSTWNYNVSHHGKYVCIASHSKHTVSACMMILPYYFLVQKTCTRPGCNLD